MRVWTVRSWQLQYARVFVFCDEVSVIERPHDQRQPSPHKTSAGPSSPLPVLRPTRRISPEEIVARCFYPLINEGFRCLEEGIAEHPADIDVVWAHGYAWPRWRGGPMFWADEIGARTLVREMVRRGACIRVFVLCVRMCVWGLGQDALQKLIINH